MAGLGFTTYLLFQNMALVLSEHKALFMYCTVLFLLVLASTHPSQKARPLALKRGDLRVHNCRSGAG